MERQLWLPFSEDIGQPADTHRVFPAPLRRSELATVLREHGLTLRKALFNQIVAFIRNNRTNLQSDLYSKSFVDSFVQDITDKKCIIAFIDETAQALRPNPKFSDLLRPTTDFSGYYMQLRTGMACIVLNCPELSEENRTLILKCLAETVLSLYRDNIYPHKEPIKYRNLLQVPLSIKQAVTSYLPQTPTRPYNLTVRMFRLDKPPH